MKFVYIKLTRQNTFCDIIPCKDQEDSEQARADCNEPETTPNSQWIKENPSTLWGTNDID